MAYFDMTYRRSPAHPWKRISHWLAESQEDAIKSFKALLRDYIVGRNVEVEVKAVKAHYEEPGFYPVRQL